jgi:hypothetical protein
MKLGQGEDGHKVDWQFLQVALGQGSVIRDTVAIQIQQYRTIIPWKDYQSSD